MQLSLTKTAKSEVVAQKELINLCTSAADKWEYDYNLTMSGINSSEETIKKLQHLSGECSVYSILGQSRSVLKMVMSVQYSLQNMLVCVQQKLSRLDQLQSLWADNMKLTYRAF